MKKTGTILGAITGDVIGSVYEWNNVKSIDFQLLSLACDYTDDTVLTIAVANSILNKKNFGKTIWDYANAYPGRGYGGRFAEWIRNTERKPYNSFGNGSAMRVSPVGFAYTQLNQVLKVAQQSAEVTHNHPEGIKGAQATSAAVFLAKTGNSKSFIKEFITKTFGYNLDFTLAEIRPTYRFDETCQGSVPQAIVAFLESTSFENAIRLAISIGGDSDTIACITGGIAAAFYKEIPETIVEFVSARLPKEFITVIETFDARFN